MQKVGLLVFAASALALPVVSKAQEVPNQAVIIAIATKHEVPDCGLKSGHFKVSSGATYLKSAYDGSDANRARLLRDADRVLREAINDNGQADNGAAWYYLGRVNLMRGLLHAADTAFTRAESLVPACQSDINRFRQRAAVVLLNPATEFARADKPDSALAYFRASLAISRAVPATYYNVGVIYSNLDRNDSAAVYFALAAEKAGDDPKHADMRNQATFNSAAVHQRTGNHAGAVTALRKYLEWMPNDREAKKALAQSLRMSGKPDEAQQLEEQMLAAAAASGDLTTNDLMAMGVSYFNGKKYAEAAESFQKVVDQAPYDRYGWYNLANTHLALKAGDKLVAAAQKLVAMEPLNEDNLKLLGEGYRLTNDQANLLKTVEKLFAMPTSLSMDSFSFTATGAKLVGAATGRQAQTTNGSNLPAAAMSITIEFVDGSGTVVTTQDLSVPALQPAAKHAYTVDATGAGIVAWRYKAR